MPEAPPTLGLTWTEILDRLVADVTRSLDRSDLRAEAGTPLLVRLSQPCPPAPASAWLAAQSSPVQVFWRGRDDVFARAGTGFADRIPGSEATDYAAILDRCRLAPLGAARYYGGFAFDEGSSHDPDWLEFGSAQFWLPRIEYVEGTPNASLCVNLLFTHGADVNRDALLAEIRAIHAPLASPPLIPDLVGRRDFPEWSAWEGSVREALSLIEHGSLEKIVLARKAVHDFSTPVVASAMMARLERVTRNCFHFCLQPSATSAFLGTTPERLFRRQGRQLRTEVIAGTRSRGSSEGEDLLLGTELLCSPKDQLEHDIVRRFLRERLQRIADDLHVEPHAVLLKLERKQHLHSPATATLREGVSDAEILGALHPTPAVGGAPSEVARRQIPRLEPFRRGWYAAPVGWVGEDAAEFAVAIRSGLLRGPCVSVYSGAGIVSGSDPAEEWAEIENKISDFRKVVGQPNSAASLRSASAQ